MFRRRRGGAFAILFAMLIVFLLAFGAIAIDGSMVRLADVECQDVADSAAHAAVLALKRTGSQTDAESAARSVIAENRVMGRAPALASIEFGDWDEVARAFSSSVGSGANAVRVRVGRTGADALPLWLAPLIGHASADVTATATAATRSLQVVLVMDITASWHQKNFSKARDAAVRFLDVLHENHGIDDTVGMVIFFQRYAWEYTPFTSIESSSRDASLVRGKWQKLNIGSVAGDYQASWATGSLLNSKHIACKVYGTNNNGGGNPWSGWCTSGSSCYQAAKRNLFSATTPVGGCFPAMPHYYSDEGGTDHTTGMQMARTMFSERNDPTVYRAMVVLTDGEPSGYSASTTTLRGTAHDTETRYRQYTRSGSHSTAQIRTDTVVLANQMHADLDVNTWFVSFVEHGTFMEDSATGDGWFDLAATSDEIVPIFERIAHSLPAAVVE
jgi:Flp pilus assembly protein TadG